MFLRGAQRAANGALCLYQAIYAKETNISQEKEELDVNQISRNPWRCIGAFDLDHSLTNDIV